MKEREGVCPTCGKDAPLVRIPNSNEFVYRCCGNETGVVVRYRYKKPEAA